MSIDNDFYKSVLDQISDGVYFVDRLRRITYWNHGAERITGYKSQDVIGRACAENILMHVDSFGTCLCTNGCPLTASMQDGQAHEAHVFLHHARGHRVPVLVKVTPLTNESGTIIGAVETFSDNSLLIHAQSLVSELELAVNRDPLTGLLNRRGMNAQVEAALITNGTQPHPNALLMLDIDHFKRINDSYGHPIGDQVLRMVADTLQANLRASDALGRWGGEEFVVLLQHVGPDDLHEIAEKLRILVEHSHMPYENQFIGVTISIGATLFRKNDTTESMLQRADQLLYQSKTNGRNRVTLEQSPA